MKPACRFVDACMRYLRATGWINFRMRAMLGVVRQLSLVAALAARRGPSWRGGSPTYEPGIHWPQMQMQSGTTGINTIRIYNPVKQGQDQDPTGAFIRRWVPELAEVPDMHLQMPWLWPGAGWLRDPVPVVDLVQAARAAREAAWGQRQAAGFRGAAGRIVERHASRKDPRFADDRDTAPRCCRRDVASPAQQPRTWPSPRIAVLRCELACHADR